MGPERLKSTGVTATQPETRLGVDDSVIGENEMNEDGKNDRDSLRKVEERQWLSHEDWKMNYFLPLKTRWLGWRGRGKVRAWKANREGCPGRVPALMALVKEAETGILATVTAAWLRLGHAADKDCGQERSRGDGVACWYLRGFEFWFSGSSSSSVRFKPKHLSGGVRNRRDVCQAPRPVPGTQQAFSEAWQRHWQWCW